MRSAWSSVCASTAAVDAGKLIEALASPDGTTTLVGLAPNGNATVSVDGTAAPVSNNIYVVRGTAFDSVSLENATGESTSFPLP